MKKFLAALLLVTILASSIAFAAPFAGTRVSTSSKPGPYYSSGGTGKSKPVGKTESYKTSCKWVRATGKCNIRRTASLQGKSLGTFRKGEWMTYLGKRQKDTRDVWWYQVLTPDGVKAWVSSHYTVLVG